MRLLGIALAVLLGAWNAPMSAWAFSGIEEGMTQAEVTTRLGTPSGEIDLGDTLILLYPNGEVRLQDDRVIAYAWEDPLALQARLARQAEEREQRRQVAISRRDEALADPKFRSLPEAEQAVFWHEFRNLHRDVPLPLEVEALLISDRERRLAEWRETARANDERRRLAQAEARRQFDERARAREPMGVINPFPGVLPAWAYRPPQRQVIIVNGDGVVSTWPPPAHPPTPPGFRFFHQSRGFNVSINTGH
jgi:hypothetical protein